jgi:heat shock protein HslJ
MTLHAAATARAEPSAHDNRHSTSNHICYNEIDIRRNHNMKKTLGILSLVTLSALVACALPPAPPPRGSVQQQPAGTTPMQMTLTGTYWRLAAFRTQVELVELSAPNNGAIQFATDGNVAGNSGCNTFMGNFETMDNNIIKIAPAGMTLMACENDLMVQETALMEALPLARTYKITGQVLQLFDGSNAELLRYNADQPAALTGANWSATMINNGKGAVSSLVAGSEVSAMFNTNGSVTGKGGCNNYNGPFTTQGNTVKIGPVASTMMACEEAVMQQETAYFNALQNSATYTIRGDTLELRAADGALQVSFVLAK